MSSRPAANSAIPITNPNLVKPPPEQSESPKDSDSPRPDSANPATDASPTSAAAAVNHPSSTVAPIAEIRRPVAARPADVTWNALDMGGINIKQIPPNNGLFKFTFLVHLFLNHNALSYLPPEISKLRHLELLDISGNNLQKLPPELGMLTQLKELYLFDNSIVDIPYELGTLHQLRTLGVEGNPLDSHLKQMIQTNGTSYLISYLRDNCNNPPAPPSRQWIDMISPVEREAILADPSVETFSVMCFNILCERAATEKMYGYTPSWALAWDYRKKLIMQEIQERSTDFICLQEVDIAQYEEFFSKNLADEYEGVYWPKSRYKTIKEDDRRQVDGCATFYRTSKSVLFFYRVSDLGRSYITIYI
jgi:CCR4-NOT transcription complex subunit 6